MHFPCRAENVSRGYSGYPVCVCVRVLLLLSARHDVASFLHPFPPSSCSAQEEEEEEEMVKGPVEVELKQLVPLGEELEKTSGPQEPAQWAEGHSEAQQSPTPEEPVARNGENIPLAEEEPPKALELPSVEEGVSSVGTCMCRLHPSVRWLSALWLLIDYPHDRCFYCYA